MIKEKNNNESLENILTEDLTLVDVYANWCGPCKMIAPIVLEVTDKLGINLIKVDIDENMDVARAYKIDSIPTLLLFKNKELLAKEIGYKDKDFLEKWLLLYNNK